MSLDDIWEQPLIQDPTPPPKPSDATKTRRPALFLSDSDEDDDGVRQENSAAKPSESSEESQQQPLDKDKPDALFGNLDDNEDIFADVGVTDVEKLKRQAEAKIGAKRGALPSGSASQKLFGQSSSPPGAGEKGDKSTKRKEIPKLNEERLLGSDGFPRLLNEYKNFKPSGKGRELVDLERLFRLYHGWTHKLFPKYQFRDTVDRVERLCRSRRMAVNLRVWRDEAHGINLENRDEDSDDSEKAAQSDDEHQTAPSTTAQGTTDGPVSSSPSSSRPSTPMTRSGSVMSRAPSVPSSMTDVNDMDMDIDTLLREEEELMREIRGGGNGGGDKPSSYKPATEDDDEEALWATTGGMPDASGSAAPALNEADNEDLWSAIDETMQKATTPTTTAPQTQGHAEIGADWDDMYE